MRIVLARKPEKDMECIASSAASRLRDLAPAGNDVPAAAAGSGARDRG